MSNDLTLDERLQGLEQALRTAIIFNMNASAVLGRRITSGNEAIANALAQDLRALKSQTYDGINKQLHDGYVDALILSITGKA